MKSLSRERDGGQELSNPIKTVIAQKPSYEQSLEEPPTKSQDIDCTGIRRNSCGWKWKIWIRNWLPENGCEKDWSGHKDGPDVKRRSLPNLQHAKIQEAGDA